MRRLSWCALTSLIAGLGVLAPAGTATASATFPGTNGRIAVVVTNPKDAARPTSVMTMSPDGSHRKVLVHTRAGRDAGPTNVAFSPDGRRIVFDRRACPDTCHSNVGVVRSDGSHMRRLTHRRHGFDTNFGFSPDGSLAGFTRDGDGIFVVGAHGGRPTRLTREEGSVAVTSPSFSPDGTSVLFHRFEASSPDASTDTICVVAIASREQSCLAEGSSPRWAPNGHAILFTDADGSGIATMRPDGSHRTLLISGSRMRPLEFSPDGHHFAFLREAARGRTLVVATSDGARRRTISHDRKDFEDDFDVAFSPNGRKLIYRRSGRKGFSASRIDGSHEQRIRVTPRRIEGPGGSLAWARRPGD